MVLAIRIVAGLVGICQGCLDTAVYREVFLCTLVLNITDLKIAEREVESRVQCAIACTTHDQCASFRLSRDAPFTCTLLNTPQQSQTCNQYVTTTYRTYDNLNLSCLNGGVPVPGSGNCTCFDGYVGHRCERLMIDCAEGEEWGFFPPDQVATIQPHGSPQPFQVLCESDPWGTRTYFMVRLAGTVDFSRNWTSYKEGFGDLKGEFWLGLDNIHYLTTAHPQNFLAEVHTRLPGDTYPYRQRAHSKFTVGAESTGYVMNFAYTWTHAPPHDIGDCLTAMKGKKFSTFDVDNDDDPGKNCAAVHQGSWWYAACGQCNPTGPLIRFNDGYLYNIPNETFWYPGIANYSLFQIKFFLKRP